LNTKTKSIPYASANSKKARDDITKMLERFGCDKAGVMDDWPAHEVLVYFEHRGRQVQLRASAKGWAQMSLQANPYKRPGEYYSRRQQTEQEYRQAALKQGHIAVNSILRDWIKGQLTAVECGILSFEAVFLPYMLTHDGRPLIERIKDSDLLPKPTEEKVVSLPKPA